MTPICLASCTDDSTFCAVINRKIAVYHFCGGILVCSNIVPVLTVKFFSCVFASILSVFPFVHFALFVKG